MGVQLAEIICGSCLSNLDVKSEFLCYLQFFFLCYRYESFVITKSYHLGGLFVIIKLNSLQALTQQKEVGFCQQPLSFIILLKSFNPSNKYFFCLFYHYTVVQKYPESIYKPWEKFISPNIIYIVSLTLGLQYKLITESQCCYWREMAAPQGNSFQFMRVPHLFQSHSPVKCLPISADYYKLAD